MKNFFCNVIVAVLSLMVTTAPAFSNVESFEQQDFADAKNIERSFVVGSLTGFQGEYEFDRWVNFFNKNSSFCIPSKSSRAQKASEFAKKFIKDFNEFAPQSHHIRMNVVCNDKSPNRFIFLNRLGASKNIAEVYCDKGRKTVYDCTISFGTKSKLITFVPHEMFNALGFNDSVNSMFINCIVFDNDNKGPLSRDFCDIEKRLISFKFTYTFKGMNSKRISKAFDKHWKTSTETEKLAKKVFQLRQEVSPQSSDTQLEEFCQLMFTNCSSAEILSERWFCKPVMFGETSFCQQYKADIASGKLQKPKRKSSFSSGGNK